MSDWILVVFALFGLVASAAVICKLLDLGTVLLERYRRVDEVVHCKDCKFWDESKSRCNYFDRFTEYKWFCWYGYLFGRREK